MTDFEPKLPSIGRNIEKLRKLRGMKQEVLAKKIGVSPQTISRIEQSETIDEDKLQAIAEALDIPAEAIRQFNEDTAITLFNNITNNTFESNTNGIYQVYQNFSPIDKIVQLYDALLKSEREKIALLESLLKTGTPKG